MLIKAILLGLVGIVGVIDSRLIGRQNIGRPLILSTLAGLVLGDVDRVYFRCIPDLFSRGCSDRSSRTTKHAASEVTIATAVLRFFPCLHGKRH